MELKLVEFGKAIEALKEGKRVCRSGWNGKGLFVFMQVPARISVEKIVPVMQSLPPLVKVEFKRRFQETTKDVGNDSAHNHSTIDYVNQLALVKPDNTINGWSPSTEDALSKDWVILD
jgi:hypothetical protein